MEAVLKTGQISIRWMKKKPEVKHILFFSFSVKYTYCQLQPSASYPLHSSQEYQKDSLYVTIDTSVSTPTLIIYRLAGKCDPFSCGQLTPTCGESPAAVDSLLQTWRHATWRKLSWQYGAGPKYCRFRTAVYAAWKLRVKTASSDLHRAEEGPEECSLT